MVIFVFFRKLFRILPLLILLGFLCSCTPVRTKNVVDRVYELDPRGKIFVSKIFLENPPKTVAVLPFRSQVGEGRVEGSEELFKFLSRKGPSQPESVGERMRRAL